MSKVIVLYDLTSTVGTWSPNVWKVRYSLHVKGIPYRTIWVEYPDIKETCVKIGAQPTGTRDGGPLYTLPVIQDPSTNKVISDSMAIARYLDETYPNTPAVMAAGTQMLHFTFQVAVLSNVRSLASVVMPLAGKILYPVSEEFYRETREKLYGKLEEMSPPGPIRARQWQEAEAGTGKIDEWYKKFGDPPFVMGETISFSDIYLWLILKWMQKVIGEDSEEWQNVKTWHGGRWARLLERLDGLKSTEER